MTPSHDEPPAPASLTGLSGGLPRDAAAGSGGAISRGAAILDRVQSLVPHAQNWWDRHRDAAQLAGPAACYLAVVCVLLFGTWGLLVAVLVSAVLVKSGPNVSADTMLSLYRAQPIAPRQGAALRAALATLSARAELKSTPAIAIIPSMAVGAFSAGQEPRTAIMMTEGLLRRYSLREIVAITAHEVAHMKAGDLAFFSLADVMTRLAQFLSYLGTALFVIDTLAWLIGEDLLNWWVVALLLLAPFLNSQLQLALSRQREYDADRMASSLLGGTEQVAALALAMEPDFGTPLDDFRFPVPQRRSPIPSPARAHLAGSIRAERLRNGDPPPLLPALTVTDEPLVSLVGVGPIEMRPRNRWPGLWF
ncbi:MAG: M48 family metalloprotease [Hyphomicrobiaceae bacterium]